MASDFVHLHVHTHYSLLDGLTKIEDLVDKTEELGMEAVAITDHGVMYGAPEFYDKAVSKGIKPIIGCEFYLNPNGMEKKQSKADDIRHHLVLLARNNTGYKNLMKLATEAHLKGFYYKPRIDLQILEKYSEGLIGLSACVEGEIPSLIISKNYPEAKKRALEYQRILGEGNFYLEIQHIPNLEKQNIANEGLKKLSKETGIPLVATTDSHYVNPEDNEFQDILLCIQTGKKVDDTNRLSLKDIPLHFKTPEEMKKNFADTPEAIENTVKIAKRCNVEIEFGHTKLPRFDPPEGYTDCQYLRELCEQGLKEKYGENITSEHRERMDYELDIISKMGFSSYFLIVQDFTNWAKKQNIIVGPGRGSAAGSIVAYLTGITNVDPIKYSLLFERFLNPDRVSMPDIDLDFADHRRDEVLTYVRKKYGYDHVAQIITFGTMAARAAIRDAGRVLGVEYNYCDKLSKMVPAFNTLNEALENSREILEEYNSNADAKKIIDAALSLEGIARHASVHACGVVITDKPVTEYSPLQYITGKEGTDEGIVTQYSASSKSSYVEKIGLLKMDFLGLRNLTIIENALRVINKTTGDFIDIEKIFLEDEKTFELLQKGNTTGVFQLESSGMKSYLQKLKPNQFEDVIAMVALYRPGPMDWIPDFIDRKHGRKAVEYLHPKLEPILNNTYGVAIYQEQVMQIARDLAGFSLGEADILRKAMGKKIHELIQEQKEKFIQGAKKNGISEKMATEIFSFIEPFAGYGFNRSHAACYGLIGYQTAFLKAHYPAQFMAALLNSDKDDIDRIAIEIEEARAMGIEVLPPDVNESLIEFALIQDPTITKDENTQSQIRFGLEAIKGVGHNIAEKIINERKRKGPFKDIIDLVERVNDKDLNKKSLEALAMSGALDNLIERNKMLQNVETILNYAKNYQKNMASGQSSLFSLGGESKIETPQIKLEETRPAPKAERLSWERALLGLYVSDHPLRGYQDYFKAKATAISDLSPEKAGQVLTIGGIITKLQKIYTRNNQIMYFATLEDGLGKIEALIFPKTVERNRDLWEEEKIVLLKGKLSDKDNELKLLCEDGILVDGKELREFKKNPEAYKGLNSNGQGRESSNRPKEKRQKIILYIDDNFPQDGLKKISEIVSNAEKGSDSVVLALDGTKKRLEIPGRIKNSSKIINKFVEILGSKEKVLTREV
ncbi:MAG: DNA polymerase III subunit alpha [Patescibacteria group bacterium]